MNRSELFNQARDSHTWDIVIIGGGATGLGSAVDAVARGYRTLLIEASDFAKGTSSRSTKLVHGGVRYLAQGNIGLVRDALHERGLMQRNAPQLVHTLPLVIPAYNWWDQPFYGAGLISYDLLAGNLSLGRSWPISRAEALKRVPTLEPERLKGGVLYYDGQFDDTRYAVALLRTFLDLGGVALNYTKAIGFTRSGERINGVIAQDIETGVEFTAVARAVVNATGVYVDAVRSLDEPQSKPILSPSQGVHIVLDRSFMPGDTALMIPRTDDGRVLFAIPWHERVVIGTTDTPIRDAAIEPRALPEEIEFLIKHAARYLTRDPVHSDVLSIYAGLRPLVKAGTGNNTSALSRDHTLIVSQSGLITVTGGKWTTYRHMGEDTINRAIKVGNLAHNPSTTRDLKLHGWSETPDPSALAVYGSDADSIRKLAIEQPDLARILHARLPYRAAEVVWAARYELARTVEDVLARRTRALLLDARASIEAAPRVAELLAGELGLDQAWRDRQVAAYTSLAEGYILR
ncbi:MAG: glycerol-3-phosphate dehydrogenase/oxidase [Roseiflexaceae bacterium]|nr:glycerol-3-phosphate dehydrogenase/oxidase [Roseiflexaceae bacterium]